MRKTCRGKPVLITGNGHRQLKRIMLGGLKSEAWLQKLMHDHPSVLPIDMIEPAFGDPIAIAREVPCVSGFIDNLFLTPTGEIILVEAKLWRNAELRRKVVAQALDYVAALTRLDYPAFEAMIIHGCKLKTPSLHALVAHHPDAYDEPEFVDAVARNLKRGRMLVMAVAEGVREETESLVGLFQSHAGAHFTFALVELGCWEDEQTGDIVVVPDTLARTVMIERGIVIIEDAAPKVLPMPAQAVEARPHSISEAMFYEELGKRDAALPDRIRAFLKQVEPLGVYPDLKNTLSLKVDHPDLGKPINFGYISRGGKLATHTLGNVPLNIARRYTQRLCDLIGGQLSASDGLAVTTNGSSAPLISDLLPDHADAWAEAIRTLLAEVSADPGQTG